jgi:hypothetical protein
VTIGGGSHSGTRDRRRDQQQLQTRDQQPTACPGGQLLMMESRCPASTALQSSSRPRRKIKSITSPMRYAAFDRPDATGHLDLSALMN